MEQKRKAKDRGYTLADLMTVAASREVRDNEIVFAGTGIPMLSIMLAQRTHAPHIKLIFESGTFGQPSGRAAHLGGRPRCETGSSRSSGLCEAFSSPSAATSTSVFFLSGAEMDGRQCQHDRYRRLPRPGTAPHRGSGETPISTHLPNARFTSAARTAAPF